MSRLIFPRVVMALSGVAVASLGHADGWYVAANAAYSSTSSEVFNDGTNGAGNPKIDVDDDARFGVAIGRELFPGFRLELEYASGTYNTDSGLEAGTGIRAADSFGISSDLDVDLLTLAASYELNTGSMFAPFVKVGVGSTFFDMDADLFVSSFGGNNFGGALPTTFSYSGSGEEFAYYVGLGTALAFSETLEMTIEYRYQDLGEVATDYDANGDRIQTDLDTSNVQVGIRYRF